VALRGVVHAEVVADPAHDDLAGVEADPRREVEPALPAQRLREAAELVAQVQGRVAGALRVVLVRDRGAEERQDAVAGELVHRPLEAVHALGEQLEEAVHDPVPLLGIELLGELHRALHVGEEDGHLLALALEGARGEDLVGEVSGRVGRHRPGRPALDRCVRQGAGAGVAEPLRSWV
jgi:hypothetical protein